MWFRRDLRVHDHSALQEAAAQARDDGDGRVVPLFIVDPALWDSAGDARRAYLVASLDALGASLGRNLLIRHGDPRRVIPEVVAASAATSVHISADFGPYGARRDDEIEASLDIPLIRTGSPYAVAPGRVNKGDGTAYRVFTPFYRGWLQHGWRPPAGPPPDVEWWMPMACEGRPAAPPVAVALPPAGEEAARERWAAFRETGLADYADLRNRPDLSATSGLSPHLRWGEIHPRTLLADLGAADEVFRKEVCWREFYADVLAREPGSSRHSLDARFDNDMRWDDDPDLLRAWREGRTGYPLVDAGMRQLLAEGWMHNRVRMVVASFLVKDLHQRWQHGAEHFMRHLVDGDLASNAHGWQWTAGCGTDAAPFYRIFNPVGQGLKFDPDGSYVRRYVPELAHLPGATAHEPWDDPHGYAHGYPQRIVDHAHERAAALADFAEIKRDR